ncbi:MAG: thiamine pyrophosphate-dependent enzyme, partial [Clostridia bacterium]
IEDLAHDLREAFRIAASGRPGPVLVDIPKDITAQVCEYVRVEKPAYDRPCAPREELLKAAAMLAQAERPLLYVGGGAVSADCTALLQEIAERLDLPVCYTMMGTGLFRWDDPRSLGMIGMHGTVSASRAAAAADVILAVGTRFSDRTATDKAHFIAQAQLIQLDIDPAEMGKNIPVACAMVGDVAATLQQLLPLLHPRNHPMWWNVVRTFQGEDETPIHPPDTLSPYAIMEAVTRVAGEEAILTTDVGQHQMWAVQYGRRTKPRTFLTSGGLGTMGYGYGAAMGAQVAAPDRPVIHLTGDGSFHMNLNELATAVSFQLPVVTVVFNNRVLGMVRQWQKVFYEGRYAYTTLDRQTDYVKLAEAFGALGFRCTTKTELEQALHTALEAKRPAVIDCPMDCDERVLPMIPPGKNIDDVIRA